MKSGDFNKEIAGLSVEDLKERARKISEELMKLRFKKAARQLEQSHQLTSLRRDLARVKTVLQKKAKES